MIRKIIIIALSSVLLTGCGNNNNISENEIPNDNYYARLNTENPPLNENINENVNTDNDSGEIQNKEPFGEERKSYIADSFEKEDLLPNTSALSTFTTPILTSDSNRYHNIKTVSNKLNGYILENNEVFSFNDVCGPYGKDDGYKEATILLSNGKEDKGYGGGVCQLSSTLYNAVKDLDIDIVERHHHSAPVAYVPKNEDATVSLQSNLDFKFKNISGKDLRFQTTSSIDSLTVSVYEI